MPRVLLVDDEAVILMLLEDAFHDAGCETCTARSAEEARRILAVDTNFDVIVSDNNMGKETGLNFLRASREMIEGLKTILITGSNIDDVADMPIIRKPFGYSEVVNKVKVLLNGPPLAA